MAGGCCESGSCDNGADNPNSCATPDFKSENVGSEFRKDNMLIAVVREEGISVDVFDAKGRSRQFRTDDARLVGTGGRICFSTHHVGNGTDLLLTPCFDENGEHGEPEEGCFCGEDDPHIHAHVYNPNRCDHLNDDVGGCSSTRNKNASGKEADLSFLAQLTLYPVDDDDSFNDNSVKCCDETSPLVKFPINESLPNMCNSKDLMNAPTNNEPNTQPKKQLGKIVQKVQHDDHFDYLVLNSNTGNLHLEHPCSSCGDTDNHGVLQHVGTRQLANDDSDHVSELSLHFFEASKKPFNVLDAISEMFDFDSSRVAAVRTCHAEVLASEENEYVMAAKKAGCCTIETEDEGCCSSGTCAMETYQTMSSTKEDTFADEPGATTAGIVRSKLFVRNICCSAEVPAIKKILTPLPGVQKVLINVPTKFVYVDHVPSLTPAQGINDALNFNKFGSTLKHDGANDASGMKEQSHSGVSRFFVEKICCSAETPIIKSILEPMSGILNVSANVTNQTVCVEHIMDQISASDIAEALNNEGFGVTIKKDAGQHSAFLNSISTTSFVESRIYISNLLSKSDEENVNSLLSTVDVKEIRSFSVNKSSKIALVSHNPYLISVQRIVDVLGEGGLQSSVAFDGAADGKWALQGLEENSEDQIEHFETKVKWTVIVSGVCWLISMLSLIGGHWEHLKYVGLLSVVFGLPPILLKAYKSLRRCQFDVNCLMSFAVFGALALQEFTEAAAVTFLFSISENLESRATARARNALSAIVNLRPDRANLINPMTNDIVVVPAEAVAVGALVSVRTGDKIPCDGVVVEGKSAVDESSLTGESRPVKKGPDDKVSGGTLNIGETQLVVKTTATVDNSAVARLIRLVEEAQANSSPTEQLVDEFAKRYTPLVILAAISMCTIPWIWGKETGKIWVYNGLVTIVIACPCALIISTPITYVAGLAACAQRGVIVKGGAFLEALGMVKKVAFDKTGTLTEGKFALLHLNVIGRRRTREEVLEYMALIQARASHPIGAAIVQAAKNENVSISADKSVESHILLQGEGVSAVVNGKQFHIGNPRLFQRIGYYDDIPETSKALVSDWASIGGTVGFLGIEGEGIIASYCVADAVRKESKSVVGSLEKIGISVTMLTGDGNDAANAIGEQVGLTPEGIRSELFPKDKLDIVNGMIEEGLSEGSSFLFNLFNRRKLVLMCGDGVNDAPALAAANVGVAMGAGAALAMETSDVTLMDSDLNKLLYSIKMGKRVIRTIKENVAFSLISKAVVMGFTFAGKASLWAAIVTDVGAMLIVTLNGMKLLPSKKKVKNVDITPDGNHDGNLQMTAV